MGGTWVCAVPSDAEVLKVYKGGLWGRRLTLGTTDDCTILVGHRNTIWSKLKARRTAVAAFGELDHDGRRVRSGGVWLTFGIFFQRVVIPAVRNTDVADVGIVALLIV
uniref:Uncharacterized protein n=1 Tax=Romanomermis culicivorax TaxID=13658 RepID=A0A915HVE6_ROMCU